MLKRVKKVNSEYGQFITVRRLWGEAREIDTRITQEDGLSNLSGVRGNRGSSRFMDKIARTNLDRPTPYADSYL